MKQAACSTGGLSKYGYVPAVMLSIFMIWGCSSTTTTNNITQVRQSKVTQMQQNNGALGPVGTRAPAVVDKRTDQEIAGLLPAGAFDQQEFPKTFMITMMRACIGKNNDKNPNNPIALANKVDPFCGCLTNERVHNLTMNEFLAVDGNSASPELLKKNQALKTKCLQSVLK